MVAVRDGIAQRVLAREPAGRAGDALTGPAEDRGERLDERGGDHRHADEQDEAPAREQREHRRRAEAAGEQADRDHARAERDRRRGDPRHVPREAGRRQCRPLAHRGDRRHARRAQGREEPRDERDQDAGEQADDDGPRREHRAAVRELIARRGRQRGQRPVEPEAEQQATDGAEDADRQRLDDDRRQDLPATRAERPQRRELARALGDRDRERVEDDEGADEERDGAEREQQLLDDRHLLVAALGLALHLGRARGDGAAGGHERLERAHELLRRDAVLPRRPDLVEPAGFPEQRLRGRDVEDRERQLADRVEAGEPRDAGDREFPDRAARRDADPVADGQVVLLSGAGVDRRLRRSRRPAARGQPQRVEPARARARVDAEADGRVAGRDRLAAAVDEPRAVDDPARCRFDLGPRRDPVEQGGRHGGIAARRSLDDRLARDDGVRAGVGAGEERVDRPIHPVGERVGPADHGDAEDDRQRGQRGAQLAAREAPERDPDHRALTSSIAASTSCALERPRSRTMRPSARKTMRSAIAAALGSCVTITVVWP